jgi:hypothetical protein
MFASLAQPLLTALVSYIAKNPQILEELAGALVQLAVSEVKKALPVQQ